MNTPAHLILAAAIFAKPDSPKRNLACLAGAMLPDLSLYGLAGWALYVQNVPPDIVFDEYYFSDRWQLIFAIDNSFVLWGLGLVLALLLRAPVWSIFALAGLLHLVGDFALHNDDARRHFWPLSDWVFQSPVSYWDPAHHGGLIGTLELILCVGLCVLLWRRFHGVFARFLIAGVGVAEALPLVLWTLMFAL